MNARTRTRTRTVPLALPEVVPIWIRHILVGLGGHRKFLSPQGFADDAIAVAAGLRDPGAADEADYDAKTALARLRRLHAADAKMASRVQVPSSLADNVERLARLVGLNEVDRRILEFAVLVHSERVLDDAADLIGPVSAVRLFCALAVLLDIPTTEVRVALSPEGALAKSGLLSVSRTGLAMLRGKLDLLSDGFADNVLCENADPTTYLRGMVDPGRPATLALSDFAHAHKPLSIARPYLLHVLESGRKGCNILIHGAPGTGKSELARTLAREFGTELFEVASADEEGDPVPGIRRLRALRAAQGFFGHRRALLVFDEVEDVFNDGEGPLGRRSTAQRCKAWINRALEENVVPTVWVTNSIRDMDPAFIRRFDMVI